MDSTTTNIWCWLIPPLVGIICGIIVYYWRKSNVETVDTSAELKSLREKNSRLQSDLDTCNQKLVAKASGDQNRSSSLGTTTGKIGRTGAEATTTDFDAAAAKTAFGKTIKQDDLKVVEGIGPKIADMFNKAGIKTWNRLSETSVASCQEILTGGGERYKIHDPASWPMQAKMCYEGKWKELFRWQKEHTHGKL